MQHQKLARHLSVNPAAIVYVVTMETVIYAIVKHIGKEVLSLAAEDIELAKEVIKAAIDHYIYFRDYLDELRPRCLGNHPLPHCCLINFSIVKFVEKRGVELRGA